MVCTTNHENQHQHGQQREPNLPGVSQLAGLGQPEADADEAHQARGQHHGGSGRVRGIDDRGPLTGVRGIAPGDLDEHPAEQHGARHSPADEHRHLPRGEHGRRSPGHDPHGETGVDAPAATHMRNPRCVHYE